MEARDSLIPSQARCSFRANEQGRFWLKFRCHFPVCLNRDPKPEEAFVLLQYNECQDVVLSFMEWITRAFCP